MKKRKKRSGHARLLVEYFYSSRKYKTIFERLENVRGISKSMSWLKRQYRRLRLKRRCPDPPAGVIKTLIESIMDTSDSLRGYRSVWRILFTKYRIRVRRDTVMKLMKEIDPDGVETRRGRRLKRRLYHSKQWEEYEPCSPVPNMESHPPQPHCVTKDQELSSSPHNSESVVPASVSLFQSESQEQMGCETPMECSEFEAIVEGCLPFVVNSTAIAIANSNLKLHNTSVHNEQVMADQLPQQEDDLCYRCDHMKILVFLVTCCNATVCRTCADEIVKYQKCPFCNQCVGDIRRVM